MYRFERLSPDRIEAEWERIGALLQPAIAHDEKRVAVDVRRDLQSGILELYDVDLYRAKGLAVTEIGLSTANVRCMWIVYIAGHADGQPREWLSRLRTLTSYLEGIARAEGCKEMRVEGRDWSRVLTKYERLNERPGRNELRRVL
jgi:hypothetical protein